jgi:hypothetical protein
MTRANLNEVLSCCSSKWFTRFEALQESDKEAHQMDDRGFSLHYAITFFLNAVEKPGPPSLHRFLRNVRFRHELPSTSCMCLLYLASAHCIVLCFSQEFPSSPKYQLHVFFALLVATFAVCFSSFASAEKNSLCRLESGDTTLSERFSDAATDEERGVSRFAAKIFKSMKRGTAQRLLGVVQALLRRRRGDSYLAYAVIVAASIV